MSPITYRPLVLVVAACAISACAQGQSSEDPVDARVLLHKNGAATVAVDGKSQKVPPGQFKNQAPKLLAGKKHLLLEMEDWTQFETTADQQLSGLYEIGIRSVTLSIDHQGKKETRTARVAPPRPEDLILKGDDKAREKALDHLETMLRSAKVNDRCNAMISLRKVGGETEAKFDRSRFLPLVRNRLEEGGKDEAAQAMGAIAVLGGDETDIPHVLKWAEDENPAIRVWIAPTLVALNRKEVHPDVGPTIEKLLHDPNHQVRVASYKCLWGAPTTPGIDAALIELSRQPSAGGGDGYDSVYYALSTRPLVRKPVAQRLIELIGPNSPLSSRAVWGISHHAADDEARPIVVDALIQVVDQDSDSDVRQGAIWGLGFHGGEKAQRKLQAIVDDANESQAIREYARQQLARHRT